MRKFLFKRSLALVSFLCGLMTVCGIVRTEARPRSTAAAQADANSVSVGAEDIGGVVTSANGPEAGVWVIAETTFGTKFRKIVVTNDRGQYLLPQLPNGNYKVWVRGYGLVDSTPVEATPGKNLNLTAVIAPDARAAARVRILIAAATVFDVLRTLKIFPLHRRRLQQHRSASYIAANRPNE